ncbi:MAG TPA: hypothetical protein DEP42_07180, partial [Ruminococcaceae bacterium]|nr:hypothetical protein [Oscillospiraceae bacterium]
MKTTLSEKIFKQIRHTMGLLQKERFVQAAKGRKDGVYQGMDRVQVRVLGDLLEKDNQPAAELLKSMHVHQNMAEFALSRLEAEGYISRAGSEADRHVIEVTLTDKGRAIAEKQKASREETLTTCFEGLNEEEGTQLLTLLEKWNANLTTKVKAENEAEFAEADENGFPCGGDFSADSRAQMMQMMQGMRGEHGGGFGHFSMNPMKMMKMWR